ncbi:MAG TPA: DUF881 domain-containing protein [Arachnia sp.]|nr:DUF881 domain-containing protein [Arachnia sp.]
MRRPDASMSLLTDLQADALEPEYRAGSSAKPSRVRLATAIGLVAVLITVALLQTTRGAGTAAAQRQELLDRVAAAEARQREVADQVTALDEEIGRLGQQALGDPDQRARLTELEQLTGAVAVEGPGIVVEVSDAPGADGTSGLVLDGDLTRLVNGLWTAGAEAISINGRRLTVLTPIRSAGAAITVDYVSLSPPYRLDVIGDPNRLQARFNETAAASWWHFLTQNYGVTMSISQADGDLSLPADSGMTLRHAAAG